MRGIDASIPAMKIKDNLHPLVPHTKHQLSLFLGNNIADAYPNEMNSGFEARPETDLSSVKFVYKNKFMNDNRIMPSTPLL